VNVEIARRTLRGGFLAGFFLGMGAVSVDVMYAAVSSLSFARLLSAPGVSRAIGIAGVLLLLYLAVMSFRAARRDLAADRIREADAESESSDSSTVPSRSAGSAYLTGVLMTLFNPMNVIFWFTVVPGQVTAGSGAAGLPVVGLGVFLGTMSWVVAFAGLLAWAGRYRRTWWLAAADAVGGAILFGFAAAGFLRLIHA
jgi:threonine/homoserine/homoserine lactone efflux protein